MSIGTPIWQSGMPSLADSGGWVLLHNRQHFLANETGSVLFQRSLIASLELPVVSEQGVGHWQGRPVYMLDLAEARDAEAVKGGEWWRLRHFLLNAELETFQMLGYAAQIASWVREHRFCGGCGQPMYQLPTERAMRCDACSLHFYPRLSPSMIVLITRGDELLLARSPRFVTNMYSTLAGFVEPGESVEDCVRREVREEVGVEVSNIRYIGSQNWPFPHSLMLGFHAEYAGGEIVIQEDEIEDAGWFSIHALPPLPARRSIARYLIERYVAQRKGLPEPTLHA